MKQLAHLYSLSSLLSPSTIASSGKLSPNDGTKRRPLIHHCKRRPFIGAVRPPVRPSLLSPPPKSHWATRFKRRAPFDEGDCGGGGSRFYPQTVRQMASAAAAAAELYHKYPPFFPSLMPNANDSSPSPSPIGPFRFTHDEDE